MLCVKAETGVTTFETGEEQKAMMKDEHQPYDRSSKWLIQHRGDSMLRLAQSRGTMSRDGCPF